MDYEEILTRIRVRREDAEFLARLDRLIRENKETLDRLA
jgi:hypothetical protein